MGDVYGGVPGKADERVHEWEAGLPKLDDLTPLTSALIPSDLLSAFNIPLEPYRTSGDLSRASDDTMSSIRGSNCKPLDENLEVISDEEIDDEEEGSDPKKARRDESPEEVDSSSAKALKRSRLVWMPQLHKRFVDVVAHLGIKNAVPKTIMQLMNVEGLTRENVASHLQKYRLYLKRMQGASLSEQHFPSSPAPVRLPDNGNVRMPTPMPYGMMPIPMPMPMVHMGMGNYNGLESNQNMNHVNHHHQHNHYHHHHQYNWNYAGGE